MTASLAKPTLASEYPLTVQTIRQVAVYAHPHRGERPIARINYGAVLKAAPTTVRKGCRKKWVRLETGGYVCGAAIKDTKALPAPAAEDSPDVDRGIERYVVQKGGAVSYRNQLDFQHRRENIFLYRGTVLSVKRVVKRGGTNYLVTRDGQYVRADNVKKQEPLFQLGVRIEEGQSPPLGFIVDDGVVVRERPDENAKALRSLGKFDVVHGAALSLSGKWVQLPDGGYVLDRQIARWREQEPPANLDPDEKWIAVDLEEQVLTAYAGKVPLLVVPCSTGEEANTEPGSYRIKWKRRLQTMNLYSGHLRVEDVQWVMYYIPKRGFAIHTAWHNNFGYPVSHGCVNLPRDDARWVYEWSTPTAAPAHSENFHTSMEKGTRVIVF